MTLAEAAAARGVNRRTLSYAVLKGHIPGQRIGPMWLVRLEDVDVWLANASHRPGRAPRRREDG